MEKMLTSYEAMLIVSVANGDEAAKTTVSKFVDMIKELSNSVGINMTIKDYGVKEEDLESLASKAMEDPCKPGNPREVSKEDFIELYKKAM